jgi:hypothetical protein
MKTKFLSLALSCALLSLALMPTVTADDTTGTAQVLPGSLLVTIGATHNSGFVIPTVPWSASSQKKCYRDVVNIGAEVSRAYLVIEDLDNVDDHYVNAAVTDFVGANTGGIMSVDSALYLTFEKVKNNDCDPAIAGDVKAAVFKKLGRSHELFSIAADVEPIAFSTEGNTTSWIALGNASADIIRGTNLAVRPGSYAVKIPSLKMTYPPGQVGDIYTATVTFATSAVSQ